SSDLRRGGRCPAPWERLLPFHLGACACARHLRGGRDRNPARFPRPRQFAPAAGAARAVLETGLVLGLGPSRVAAQFRRPQRARGPLTRVWVPAHALGAGPRPAAGPRPDASPCPGAGPRPGRVQAADQPPSMLWALPLTTAACSPARKSAIAAMSSGSASLGTAECPRKT